MNSECRMYVFVCVCVCVGQVLVSTQHCQCERRWCTYIDHVCRPVWCCVRITSAVFRFTLSAGRVIITHPVWSAPPLTYAYCVPLSLSLCWQCPLVCCISCTTLIRCQNLSRKCQSSCVKYECLPRKFRKAALLYTLTSITL